MRIVTHAYNLHPIAEVRVCREPEFEGGARRDDITIHYLRNTFTHVQTDQSRKLLGIVFNLGFKLTCFTF